MTEVPKGMSVRFEGATPPSDDVYRSSDPDPGVLIVEHRWRDTTENVAGQVIGCAVSWAVVALLSGLAFGPGANWFAFPISIWLIAFAFAVLVSYVVASHVWNTTTITVDAEGLVVRHGPVPMLWGRKIRRLELGVIYCKDTSSDDWEGPLSFALVARLTSGAEVVLTANLPVAEPYRFAAEQISAYLKRTATKPT